MVITYVVGSANNPLYENNFVNDGSFKTFGQHSFIYDFLCNCIKNHIIVEILTDNTKSFPLTEEFTKIGLVVKKLLTGDSITSDIIILDTLTDSMLSKLTFNGLIVGIIHNYTKFQNAKFYELCHKVVCLTEYAKHIQSAVVDFEKLEVITQGIDLDRFRLTEYNKTDPKILIYSRMDKYKGSIYIQIIQEALNNYKNITILGDGMYFNIIKEKYKNQISIANYIPCYKIHDYVKSFDIIISNGRGVMEGLACGKPTIAAGVGYCGLITNKNVDFFFERNFTGSNAKSVNFNVNEDLHEAFNKSTLYYRKIAEKLFDVSNFTSKILKLSK